MGTVCGSGAAEGADTKRVVEAAVSAARARLAPDDKPDLGLIFASPQHELDHVLEIAERLVPAADWMGCSSAGEITEAGTTDSGVSVLLASWGRAAAHRISPARPLEGELDAIVLSLCDGLPELLRNARVQGWDDASSLLLGHGLVPELEQLVTEIRKVTGAHHPLVGGGAGDDGALLTSWVGSERHVVEAGVVALHVASARPWGVGIGQGVVARSDRMTVTGAEGNVVREIDGRPALDVYRAYAASRAETWSDGELARYLIQNELGIYFFDDIVRIRAGLATTEDGAIVCAGEVPEGSTVAIVHAEPDQLVAAARAAAQQAQAAVDGDVAGVLVFSCITRRLVLGARAAEEVAVVAEVFGPDVPIAGFSSYGEIARVKGKLDGYHNHTIVVAAIPA